MVAGVLSIVVPVLFALLYSLKNFLHENFIVVCCFNIFKVISQLILRTLSLNLRYRRRISARNIIPGRPLCKPLTLKWSLIAKNDICIISNKISCLYVLVMSHVHVSEWIQTVVTWMSRNSFLRAGAKSEV